MVVKKLEDIIKLLEESCDDAQKVESGNASAGRRVRKVALEVTKELKALRTEILKLTKK